MSRITVEEIANKVGVSKGLVSRALTGKYNVSDSMRDEITRTAAAMGYDFSKLRSINKKRKKCLLILSSSMLVSEEYWQPIIRAINTTLDRAGISLEYFIFDSDDDEKIDESIQKLSSTPSSGYIFISHNPEKLLKFTESEDKPVVVIDPKSIHTGKSLQIKFSNVNTVYEITKMMIDKGHKNLLFFGPRGSSISFIEREQGFTMCVHEYKERGLHYYRILFDNSNGAYSDNEALESMLTLHPEITAIICANDIIAINAIKVASKLGKKIPEDLSIAGFDNIKESQEDYFNLTTANVPREELGIEAAKYLISHIQSQQIRYSQIIIDCEIISRGSVKDLQKS